MTSKSMDKLVSERSTAEGAAFCISASFVLDFFFFLSTVYLTPQLKLLLEMLMDSSVSPYTYWTKHSLGTSLRSRNFLIRLIET